MTPAVTSRSGWVWSLLTLGLAVGLFKAGSTTSSAQVVLDGKFGTSGALSGPNYAITAAMGSVRGNNLFQSFSQFNLVSGDVATFSGRLRVSGGDVGCSGRGSGAGRRCRDGSGGTHGQRDSGAAPGAR